MCIDVRTHSHTHTHTQTHTHRPGYVHTFRNTLNTLCTDVYVKVSQQTTKFRCALTLIHSHAHTHTHIYTHTDTNTHKHTHTHTPSCSFHRLLGSGAKGNSQGGDRANADYTSGLIHTPASRNQRYQRNEKHSVDRPL